MKQVYLDGIGCERRLLELAKLRKYFQANGYGLTSRPEKADYLVLVTCEFKKEEEDDSLARLEALSKFGIDLLVYGCLPEIAPSRLSNKEHIRYLSTKDIEKISPHLAVNQEWRVFDYDKHRQSLFVRISSLFSSFLRYLIKIVEIRFDKKDTP